MPQLERAEIADVGPNGHSLGGGMLAYVTRQVAARDWGTEGLWLFSLARTRDRLGAGLAVTDHP